jgi:hypothetical protein
MGQMNTPLIYFATLVLIVSFVLIYGILVAQKSQASGIRFGVLFGPATGITGSRRDQETCEVLHHKVGSGNMLAGVSCDSLM